MNILRKALNKGLKPSNVISWLSLRIMTGFGGFWGTLRLRVKACILGVGVGPAVHAHGTVMLLRRPGSSINIGRGASLIGSMRRATAAPAGPVRLSTFWPSAHIHIGEGAQLSGTAITARSTCISLGREVMVAPGCIITDSDFHALWPPEARTQDPGLERDAPVSIGDYTWIGLNCIILKGVRIGEGAVIGAGSVVTRDVPAFCLAAGSPAKVVRNLREHASNTATSASSVTAQTTATAQTT